MQEDDHLETSCADNFRTFLTKSFQVLSAVSYSLSNTSKILVIGNATVQALVNYAHSLPIEDRQVTKEEWFAKVLPIILIVLSLPVIKTHVQQYKQSLKAPKTHSIFGTRKIRDVIGEEITVKKNRNWLKISGNMVNNFRESFVNSGAFYLTLLGWGTSENPALGLSAFVLLLNIFAYENFFKTAPQNRSKYLEKNLRDLERDDSILPGISSLNHPLQLTVSQSTQNSAADDISYYNLF